MTNLYQRSIEIILKNQSATGAYPACPNFPTYRYSWFRDGAFIAYAMNLVGQHESAARFHEWAAHNIVRRHDIVQRALHKAVLDQPLNPQDILHTRYSLDGNEGNEDWPNFQLDGFGAWLWALQQHRALSQQPLSPTCMEAATMAADYITALWRRPCYDCWEEFPEERHSYTLAAIHGGLQAYALLSGHERTFTLAEISQILLSAAEAAGHFVKYIGSHAVDASLLGIVLPYDVFPPDHPLVLATVRKIEQTLARHGGVHRYAEDTYYGGGEWVLLTAWLGWYYATIGEMDKATAVLHWVEAQAAARGQLPEQIPTHLNAPDYYEPWRQRWGDIASPLLWSHAKYIILKTMISAM